MWSIVFVQIHLCSLIVAIIIVAETKELFEARSVILL